MSLLAYSEIRERCIIVHEDEPCEVMEAHVARTQQRKPQNQVKLRSLLSGRTWNVTYHASDTAEEAEISKREIKFLYANKGKNEYWFADPEDLKNRFTIDEKIIGTAKKFLSDDTIVTALIFEYDDEEKTIGIKLPIKMPFVIKETSPAIRGNTASGGNKPALLANGATVNVPLFLETGETILVNTDTGEYVERV